MSGAASLEAWIEARRRAVDEALDRWLPPAAASPQRLADAMRYSVFAGGKRLRPLLTLAAAEAVAEAGGEPGPQPAILAMPAACALELVHTYSLVHDDLPAMDNDTLRRGRPTAHVVYGEGMAILSGDSLLTEAFALLAREPGEGAGLAGEQLAARKLAALAVIAEAAGFAGMAGGQALDLEATAPGAPALDETGLREMHARKTGALLRASAVAGAIMAGGPAEAVAAVASYGGHLGLAFQIVDDVLDVEGASAVLGKTAGKDAVAGKMTYPALYGIERSRRLADASIEQALAALRQAGLGGQLAPIARWVVSRTH